ncbi:MAG: hypothetical protein ACYTBJ_16735 [Planctomycetota bacterium]|jgi:hypothetical protein
MKKLLSIGTLTAVLLSSLAGCTTYWYQEGKTFEQCERDRLECYEEMKKYAHDLENLGKYEFKYMEDCMIRRGYRLVTERKLYVTVKREDPNLTVPWQVHGVAGFLQEGQ